MSRTNVNYLRSEKEFTAGRYVVWDANATYNQAGALVTPVRWHYASYPQSGLTYTVETVTRISSTTPGFGNKTSSRILAPLGFSYKRWRRLASYGETRQFRPGTGTAVPVDSYIYNTPNGQTASSGTAASSAEISALNARLVTSLRNKIRGSSINAAQAVAERKMTARTVTDAATTIAKTIVALKRGNLKAAARALGVKPPRSFRPSRIRDSADATSKHWLALQYGWKPLLQDVYGAAEQLAKQNRNVMSSHVSGSVKGNKMDKVNLNLPSGAKGSDFQLTRIDDTYTIKIGVTYVQSSPAITTLKELGITNPALLAWELLPFSFVADWFLPIGNYLSSLDATVGLSFQSGYSTVFRKINGSESWESQYITSDNINFTRHIFNAWEQVECYRTPLTGFPSALTPSFKNPVSVTHAANAIALLNQLFKRR